MNFSSSLNFLIIRALSPTITTFTIKINSIKIMIENLPPFSSLSLTLISIFVKNFFLSFYTNIIIKTNTFGIIKIELGDTNFLYFKFDIPFSH